MAGDPIRADVTLAREMRKLLGHPAVGATRHRSHRARGDAAPVGTHRGSTRQPANLVDGVLAPDQQGLAPSLHVRQASGGHQVGRRATSDEGLALVEAASDDLEKQRLGTGLGFAAVAFDQGPPTGGRGHREWAKAAG